ncbi:MULTISPECIES: IclR family transcriptional regulator [unclassified Nitratireductor]|uniref:IclR family transcriptional regulator n=1 Tax=unclassified Nitratireductor TaxID=2641084 RepID=UPI0025D32894|nr:IclR family transcriptional regulator [Nitratireductor sp.]
MQNYIVESVDKALDLLMEVARRPNIGVTDLARKTGLNKSRAYRLLHTMEQRQIVKRTKDGAYGLGDAMLVLGITASSQTDMIRLATPILEELCQRVNETVQLRTIDGMEALCVAKAEPSRDLRVHANVGRRRPLYAGSPKCLLAFQSQAFIDKCVPLRPVALTANTPRSRKAILAELTRIRRQGFCISRGEVSDHQVSCAAPVFTLDNSVVATVHVVAPAFRIQESELEHIIRLTTSSAARLSRALGWTDEDGIRGGRDNLPT